MCNNMETCVAASSKRLAYLFEDSRCFTNSCSSDGKSCNEAIIRVDWCPLDEAPEVFERVRQSLAKRSILRMLNARPASMFLVAYLSKWCNCYVNKMHVFIFSAFLVFRQHFSFPITYCCIEIASLCIVYNLIPEFRHSLYIYIFNETILWNNLLNEFIIHLQQKCHMWKTLM